jgi:ribosomal protein L35AE/L33A
MSLQTLYIRFKAYLTGKGSVFVKIAQADALVLEAKGRIIAVDAANSIKNDLAAVYEKEVSRVHGESDAVKARFDAILAAL